MITSVYCIYCCKQLVHLSTRLLVNLTTFQQTKVMKKKQNRKCLYSKYLIMGIGNGMKKGYNRYFSSCNNNNTLARGMR